jgi:hypothetical protein
MKKKIKSVKKTYRSLVNKAFEYAIGIVLYVNSFCTQKYLCLESTTSRLQLRSMQLGAGEGKIKLSQIQ